MTESLLEGDTAVITGGASGNGRAIADTFAAEGAAIVIADVQKMPREGGVPTHTHVRDKYEVDAKFVKCDVTDVDDLSAVVDSADEFGGIDCMVNNAGIFRNQEFTEVTPEEFDQMISVNVRGVFFGAQCAAAKMLDNNGGTIINLASVGGFTGSAGFTTYCASKGAVRSLTYALADELAPHDIRVNAIHPGLIETKMTTDDVAVFDTDSIEEQLQSIPMGRPGQPNEVADAALYLASAQSSYVNGESLTVDGGKTNTG